MRLRNSFMLVASAALLFSACQRKAPPPTRPLPRAPAPVLGLPVSPAAFVARAASIDLFMVKSAELVQTRASDPRLREFAGEMLSAHNGTAAQLSLAGRRLNLLPSAALQPAHASLLAELEASSDFDATYRLQQLEVHRGAIRLHGDFAAKGSSPTLRPVAASAARIERAHFDRLSKL